MPKPPFFLSSPISGLLELVIITRLAKLARSKWLGNTGSVQRLQARLHVRYRWAQALRES
jgi:hypothetical protein